MQPDRTRCTECGGTMEPGYLLDHTEGGVLAPLWAGGTPQKRWIGGLKIDRNKIRPVMTDRCSACGYLKSYAVDPARTPNVAR